MTRFLEDQRPQPYSYDFVGASDGGAPAGFDLDDNRVLLGEGNACFTAAAAALRAWRMFPAEWTRILPNDSPIAAGTVVAMIARVFGLWWMNACRIVYVVDEQQPNRRFGFAYGTLPGHVECGEERFLIEQDADGRVWYRIRAFSRPRYWLVRLAYPLARRLQRRFVRDSQRAMLAAVSGGENRKDGDAGGDLMARPAETEVSESRLESTATADRTTEAIRTLILGDAAAALGAIFWIAFLLAGRPTPFDTEWAHALLLFAPLVLVPIGLSLLAASAINGARSHGAFARIGDQTLAVARALQLPAAVLLLVAFWGRQSSLAAALTLPWCGVTGLVAISGLLRLADRQRCSLAEITHIAAMLFLPVGSGWAVLDRAAVRPLDFETVIVLLTAIHFHYAGFVLPLVTGLLLRGRSDRFTCAAGLGVIAGVPLVALGITATRLGVSPLVETVAAWLLAVIGILVAGLLLREAVQSPHRRTIRAAWFIAGISLAASMILAALYGSRFVADMAWLDIPWMRALHGTANAFGFAGAGLLGWRCALTAGPVSPQRTNGSSSRTSTTTTATPAMSSAIP